MLISLPLILAPLFAAIDACRELMLLLRNNTKSYYAVQAMPLMFYDATLFADAAMPPCLSPLHTLPR